MSTPHLPLGMRLIEASMDNWRSFREIRRRALETDACAFGTPFKDDAAGDADRWQKRLAETGRHLWGIESEGRIAATLGMKMLGSRRALVFGAYTLPEFRRQGLISVLMHVALRTAKEEGASLVVLRVNSRQKGAVSLYKKLGFHIFRVGKGEVSADGSAHTEFDMAKAL